MHVTAGHTFYLSCFSSLTFRQFCSSWSVANTCNPREISTTILTPDFVEYNDCWYHPEVTYAPSLLTRVHLLRSCHRHLLSPRNFNENITAGDCLTRSLIFCTPGVTATTIPTRSIYIKPGYCVSYIYPIMVQPIFTHITSQDSNCFVHHERVLPDLDGHLRSQPVVCVVIPLFLQNFRLLPSWD